jgi:hypothetical protein
LSNQIYNQIQFKSVANHTGMQFISLKLKINYSYFIILSKVQFKTTNKLNFRLESM